MVLGAALESTIPIEWPGSTSEYIVYDSLSRLGKTSPKDFVYSPKTAMSPAFLFYVPSDLAMSTVEPFHDHPNGIELRGSNKIMKAQLAGEGINLIFLSHAILMLDPDWLVGEALQYRDHSME